MYPGLFFLQMISLLYLKLIVECKMYQHLVHLISFKCIFNHYFIQNNLPKRNTVIVYINRFFFHYTQSIVTNLVFSLI